MSSTPDTALASSDAVVKPDAAAMTAAAGGEKSTPDNIQVKCGPLLNYKGMSNTTTANPTWHGSVLIVSTPGQANPELSLRCVGLKGATEMPAELSRERKFHSERIYEDPKAAFWRIAFDVPIQQSESKWEYHIPNLHSVTGLSDDKLTNKAFFVQAANESMHIMFHSCNGFSVGTDVDAWSGCALWNEVMRQHEARPIHVMIGGGDQIYNDPIRVSGPLQPWTNMSNPVKRREFPFGEELRQKCDDWYFGNYCNWYSTEPFQYANCIIPQVNIWDDHDIIDGFGSYTDHFMKCPVFRGIGGVAHKYYLLFQHHLPPPKSTFTTDSKATMHGSSGVDQAQAKDTFVLEGAPEDPSYIIGKRPGPYVEQHSRSLYLQLGAHIAFIGLDARTERTRHQINYPDTYDLFFSHASKKLEEAGGAIKHLILLLGVPIAYPRLQWLENIIQSPLIAPVRLLNKRFGVAGSLFNTFDGGVDLMDDLDDHYTSRHHKKERREIVQRLQEISKKHSVRVTILGGDVHLAALGRFYSNPKFGIAPENDHRFMTNIVSSAITNKPPPQPVANLLASRNKIHHLDGDTDETLLNLWNLDPGEKENPNIEKKSAANNHCTMPSRNFALIGESHEPAAPGVSSNGNATAHERRDLAHHNRSRKEGNPRDPMHIGEDGCGTDHPAASGTKRTGLAGQYALDITYRVEINPHDREGKTEGYGLSLPALEVASPK